MAMLQATEMGVRKIPIMNAMFNRYQISRVEEETKRNTWSLLPPRIEALVNVSLRPSRLAKSFANGIEEYVP